MSKNISDILNNILNKNNTKNYFIEELLIAKKNWLSIMGTLSKNTILLAIKESEAIIGTDDIHLFYELRLLEKYICSSLNNHLKKAIIKNIKFIFNEKYFLKNKYNLIPKNKKSTLTEKENICINFHINKIKDEALKNVLKRIYLNCVTL